MAHACKGDGEFITPTAGDAGAPPTPTPAADLFKNSMHSSTASLRYESAYAAPPADPHRRGASRRRRCRPARRRPDRRRRLLLRRQGALLRRRRRGRQHRQPQHDVPDTVQHGRRHRRRRTAAGGSSAAMPPRAATAAAAQPWDACHRGRLERLGQEPLLHWFARAWALSPANYKMACSLSN